MTFEGVHLDLHGLEIMPGLFNAHDHLEFALFPRLGNGPYVNASEWARDVYRPTEDPIRRHLRVPKEIRLMWGGLRNLIAGATTVCHHNPWHPVFDDGFPVRVVREFDWAHSFAFDPGLPRALGARTPGRPFVLHLGEGTDASSESELFELDRLGGLDADTVLVHGVGINMRGWQVVRSRDAAVVWCPRSNLFTLGRTIPARQVIGLGIPVALGTDSSITAEGDMLDDLAAARANDLDEDTLRDSAVRVPRAVFRVDNDDCIAARSLGEQPELVVIGGTVRLVGADLARRSGVRFGPDWSLLEIENRRPVWVRYDVIELIAVAEAALGEEVRLAGRRVLS